MLVELIPHSSTPRGPAENVMVEIAREGGELWLRFTVEGDVDGVVWPVAAGAGRADELWRHTCFEAFLATAEGYVEFNLSPSGRWASYRFDRPRLGMRVAEEGAAPPMLDAAVDQVALESRIELPPGARRLGLSAVIEAADGSIGYWALAHPSDKPDFHHPDSFVLDLPALEGP